MFFSVKNYFGDFYWKFSLNQSQASLKLTKNRFFLCICQVHSTLSNIRGVIFEHDLLYSTKEELLKNLKDQSFIDVRRVTMWRKGQVLPTNHHYDF